MEIWVTLYNGYAEELRLDQGSNSTSPRFKALPDLAEIKLCFPGVKSNNSLGNGVQYHDPFRIIYQMIRYSKRLVDKVSTIRLPTETMNDTMNPGRLAPHLLALGVLPRFFTLSTNLLSQVEVMRALEIARNEMEAITAKLHLRGALLA